MTGRREFFPSPAPGLPRAEDWRTSAACAGHVDDWLWFDHTAAEEKEALEEARKICGTCPVKAQCLASAIAHKEPGIWAGTTESDRKQKNPGRCRKGHDLTLPGAFMRDRECRECRNARDRRQREERAAS